jgi:two-component sensor histidine kinase
MPNVSDSQRIIDEITSKLEKNNLLVEKTGKKTLNLEKFNNHLENASNNLGEIIPGIAQISKEQIALINHGLEGTINFISSFQTLNTAFSVFAEKPDALMKYSNRIEELENLEDFLLKDINLALTNMESMLKATFKEVAGYYTALANIIYSEEESGTITVDYKRNAYLENLLDEVMGKDRQKN